MRATLTLGEKSATANLDPRLLGNLCEILRRTALMVPMPVAILAGWTPPWMRKRQAGMRFRAYGILCTYGLTLVNGIPRIADASFETVMVCTNLGFGFAAAAAAVLLLLSARKDSGARTAGPVEPRED